MEKVTLELFIEQERQGSYFTLPFSMPPDVESLTLRYQYERHHESAASDAPGGFTARQEINIIDLGLIAPDGTQVGASGSDKTKIKLSEVDATPGYTPRPLTPGEWSILVGAYKVAPGGVTVTYELAFTPKTLRLLKGDLHAHTVGSDGVLTAEELGWKAVRHGLDFLAITDHNQMSAASSLPRLPGLTLIPGVEWTHYQGHATFLGVDRPYDQPFATNNLEEAQSRFTSARQRGALITVCHPFESGCEFKFDLDALPFDCLEVWNGPMRASNLRAVGLWQGLLSAGRKVPMCGGSDYHRDTPFIFLGGPTTCVFSRSAGPSDILAALRSGHSYVTFAPNGPSLELCAGEAIMGDTAAWSAIKELEVQADGLLEGDVLRVITASGSDVLLKAPSAGRFQASYTITAPSFARVEILRAFLPGIPMLPALISNPIYFDGSSS